MSRYEQPVSKKNSMILLVLFLAILIILAYWFFSKEGADQNSATNQIDLPVEKVELESKYQGRGNELLAVEQNSSDDSLSDNENLQQIINVNEDNSDEVFQTLLSGVSENLSSWFDVQNITQKYIVIINDISQNQILYKHRLFLKPDKKFTVNKDSKGLYLGQQSYKRYDAFANAVDAIDVHKGIKLYMTFKPLLETVFDEFSYPEEYQLEDIFLKAAASVIDAPIIENRIGLVKHSIRYKYKDTQLEALNDVQKMMIRMGPENTQKIQDKLRKLIVALILAT